MYHPLSRLLTSRHLFSSRVATWTSFALLAVLIAALPSFVQSQTPPTQPLSQPLMLGPSHGHSATLLPNGKVLIAGGENTSGTISSTDIFDPANDTFSAGPALSTSRKYHSATLLTDGHVLIAGGQNQTPLTSTEVFDPNNPIAWSVGPLLQTPRSGHSATKLADGRVVVIGGDTTGSVEIFNPTTQQFTMVPANLTTPRSFHSAALLQDGKILIVGGAGSDNKPLDSGEIYDPATQTFAAVDKAMHTARMFAILEVLPDGKVQIIGGSRDYSMEIYDPQLNAFGAYSDWLVNDPTIDPSPDAPTADDVLQARTRAALFHNSQNGALVGALAGLLDREEHTVTELQNKTTLIAGGLNSNDRPLNTAVVVSSSPATVSTSKTDYAPGEYVTITGSGWKPSENVSLLLHEEPTHHEDAPLWSVADQAGNFANSDYLMEDHDLGVTYTITAKGQTSEFIAQTAFTDAANLTAVSVGSQTGSLTYGTGGSVTYIVTVDRTGNGNLDVDLSITNWSPSLPAGVTASFSPAQVNFTGNTPTSKTSTLTITTTSATPGGNPIGTFTVQAKDHAGSTTFTANGTLTVGKATLHVAAVTKTKVYGDVNPALTYTVTTADLKNGDTASVVTGTLSRVAGETVASSPYAIQQGTLTAGTNYTLVFTGANFTITAASLHVAAVTKTKVYGDVNPALTYTVTTADLKNGDTASVVTGALTRVAGETVAGSPYAIAQGTVTASTNYTLVFAGASFTITTKAASVTPAAKSKEYGSSDPTLTGTLSGFLAADGVTATYSRTAGETVLGGPYTISAVLSPAGVLSNYDITYNTASFTITTKAASVTPAAKSKEYGSSDPTLTGTLTGFLAADGVSASYSRTAGETVLGGPYTISAVLSQAAVLTNYDITYNTASFTITTKAASVTPAAKSKEYGSSDPTLTGTLTGFLAADGVSASYSRTAGETVLGGPYTISAVLSPAGVLSNYDITYNTASFTITTKTASVTPAAKSKEYGSSDPALTGTLTGFLAADSVTATYSRTAGETVLGGPYTISAVLSPAAVLTNYDITYNTASFTITTKAASVTPAAKSKEYGSSDPALTGTLSGFLAADSVTATYSRTAGETVLGGPYTISAVLSPAAVLTNYDITYNTASFTITTKAASVTPAAKSKEYGSSDPTLTGTLSGFLAADGVTATYSRTAGETVLGGPYTISAVLSPAGVLSNYDITYNTASFTITTKAASVTPAAKSKEYGSSDPTLTGTLTGFLAADGVSASYSRTAGETVLGGPYTISAVLSQAAVLTNYDITYNTASFTITTKAASVTPAAKSKEYGSSDPALTGTLTGFLAADSVTATYSRTTGETVLGGPYTISATLSPAGVLSNYDITYNTASFIITKADPIVTATGNTCTYDGNPCAGSGVAKGVHGEDLTPVTVAYKDGTVLLTSAPVNAGAYLVAARYAGDSNYNQKQSAPATITINKATASVTPNVASKTYGASDPTLTGTLSGFLAGDGVTATYSRTTGETVAGSPYTISAALSPAGVLGNYTITYNTASFTINKALASVTPDAKSKTYGATDPALTGTLTGFLSADGVSASYSRTAGEAVAGNPYTISATLSPVGVLGNYTITYNTASFTITKADPIVTATGNICTYDGNPCAGSGSAKGVLGEDLTPVTVAYKDGTVLLTSAPVNAGAYLVAARYAGDSNYNQKQSAPATITINKATASVTPNAASKTYGDADPALTGTLGGFVAADGVTASYSRTAGETVAGNPYTISATLSPAGALGNYTITYNTASFTINKALASVTPNTMGKIYGSVDPALTGTLSGFLAGDGVTAAYSRTAGETVLGSPYIISAALSPAGVLGNYTITYNTANFTITKATASVTPNAASKTYGDADPALTGTLSGFVAADGVTASYSRTAGETVAGSPYTISAVLSPAAVLTNYTITYNTANFMIFQAASSVTLTCPATPQPYTGTAQTPCTASYLTSDGLSGALTMSYANNLNVGTAGASATYVGNGDHASSSNTGSFTISQATPTVNWSNPADITYGTALSGTQLNATASVVGSFTYTPLVGTMLSAGNNQTLHVAFSPTDTTNYTTATKDVTINVLKATLTVKADDKSKISGTANPPLTASYSGFVNGDTVSVLTGSPTLNTIATTASPVGAYPITVTVGASTAANYSFTFVNGMLTVNAGFIIPVEVTLHTVDQKKSGVCGYESNGKGKGECKGAPQTPQGAPQPLPIKVFDTKNAAFQAAYGSNPGNSKYDDIYTSSLTPITTCTTDPNGEALCYVPAKSDYLVLVQYVGPANIKTPSSKTVTLYAGKKILAGSFQSTRTNTEFVGPLKNVNPVGALWSKDVDVHLGIHIIRTINKDDDDRNEKDGRCDYGDGAKSVYSGSYLEVIYPNYTVWEDGVTDYVYPFIMTGDTDWTVNVCAAVPTGYQIVGVYDIDGNLITTSDCVQAGVAGETKVVAFEVLDLQSPPPHFTAKLKIHHKGKDRTDQFEISGHRKGKDKVK